MLDVTDKGSGAASYAGGVLPMDAATFEELVAQALDGVPPELMA